MKKNLILRIHNLLSIRDIIRKRFQESTLCNHSPSLESAVELPASERKKQEFIDRLNEAVAELYSQPDLKMSEIANKVFMSERQLFRKLKALVNMSPTHYLRDYRLIQAAVLLKKGEVPTNVALDVGFASYSYFGKCFKAKYNSSPSEYSLTLEKNN